MIMRHNLTIFMAILLCISLTACAVPLKKGEDRLSGDAIASQISAKMYEKLVLPREKLLVDAIHDNGTVVNLNDEFWGGMKIGYAW